MENTSDEFKGFGESFDGFPKRLPDDCVEYTLFIINAKLNTQRERLARLEAVRREALKVSETLTKGYIWQRESFNLKVEKSTSLMFLQGITNYGDSVEDEWLVVYILREVSSRFPDLWIKIVDTDGEFLLIEAANALPRWLNPEIAENRVWINNTQLRIIPLKKATSSTPRMTATHISQSLTLSQALDILTSNSSATIHSPLIEAESFYRLRSYPSQITASLHHSVITIPRKLAYLLHTLPTAIAPAVEAFYLRDPISLKALQVDAAELIFTPGDLVEISVKFTKVLFAQLRAQRFLPPKAWKGAFARFDQESGSTTTEKKFQKMELGMKLSCGFEMLVTDPKKAGNRSAREISILLADLSGDSTLLPTNIDISSWPNSDLDEDEKWLDINFSDFDATLSGAPSSHQQKSKSRIPGAFGPEIPPGFGDPKTQSDLKKMVERFEAFLNDNDAGVDGAEVDDMDIDDDHDDDEEDYEESEHSDDEDREVSFDEEEFTRMMREMMGMPPSEDYSRSLVTAIGEGKGKANAKKSVELDRDDEFPSSEDESEEIQKIMQRLEAELHEAGALNVDLADPKVATLNKVDGKDGEEDSDEEVNIDFNLAKNLLESFKSQGGASGPGGNMLRMMGLHLPRDDDNGKET